jgi:hypothetical protein
MKKVAFLFIAICLNFLVFGQKTLNASATNLAELKSGVASGHIQLILPNEVSSENITMYAKYYTNMFTVEYDEKSRLATFHMVTNDTFSRRVILRFLSANQIVGVQVENKNYDLGTFFENFLQ